MRTVHSIEGERWDQLAVRVYGVSNEQAVLTLRHANPSLVQHLRQFTLPAGAPVTIPDITLETLQEVQPVEVAPWQR